MLHSRIPAFIRDSYECYEWKHASAILSQDFPNEWQDVLDLLNSFRLKKSWITIAGGNKSKLSGFIDGFLAKRGWVEKQFQTAIEVDGARLDSPTHKIDCFKNAVALEIEWNNKDPFYDRDLNNFRLLYDLRVIDVGVVVTRSTALQQWLHANHKDLQRDTGTYSTATTHFDKLKPKIEGGGAGGCPVVVFSIKPEAYVDDR